MIKIDKGLIFWTLVLFLGLGFCDGFDMALQVTILIIGMIYYSYNIVFVYLRLKEVRFNLKQAASKKEWIWFLLTNVVIWFLFLTFLSESGIVMVEIIPHGLLIILLIYDIIRTLVKKIFS